MKLAIAVRVAIAKWQQAHPEDDDVATCEKTALIVRRLLEDEEGYEDEDEEGYEDEDEEGYEDEDEDPTPHPSSEPEPEPEPEPNRRRDISSRIAISRKEVAAGTIPPLAKRVYVILGEAGPSGLRVAHLAQRLKDRGWSPRSSDINTYLCTVLTQSPQFEKVKRGVYRLADSDEGEQAVNPFDA